MNEFVGLQLFLIIPRTSGIRDIILSDYAYEKFIMIYVEFLAVARLMRYVVIIYHHLAYCIYKILEEPGRAETY